MRDKNDRNTYTAFDPARSKDKGLPAPAEKADIPAGVGIGRAAPAAKGAASGGIGNATEQSRTHYAARTVTSSDGLFAISIKPVKTLVMKGDNNVTVTWGFNPS